MKKRSLLVAASALLLLTACWGDDVSVEDDADRVQEIQIPMPSGEIRHPTAGLEQWFAIGPVNGSAEHPANGVAQSHYFEAGLYLHTIQANILPAPEGFFYESWLSNGTDVKSTGHLTNNFGDSRHNVQFEANEDLRGYLQVLITLEPDDGNPEPADKVAEAILKVTPR